MKATAQATKSQPSLDKKMSKKGKAQCKADQGNKKSDDKETLFLVNWINYTFDRMQLISTDNFNGDETMDNMSFNASVMSMNQKMLCQEYAYGIKQVFENESDETIRKAGYELYSSENVLGVIKKVEKAVERGLFLIREDREVELDLGLQESFFELLFSYDLTYLTLGVQIIFTEKLSSGSKNKRKLRSLIKSTIIAKLFKVEIEVGEIFKKSNSLKAIDKKKKELLNQHIIKKFLSLVLFLDQSRLSAVLTKGTLFEKNSIFKSSKDIITNFCTLCLKAEGDIIKHLGNLGYSVSFTQSYLDEFDFKVTDLRTDLKDGVRLTRLFELLVGAEESRNNELSSQLRVPAISRLQKIHNNKVILDMLMTTTPSESETMSKKIADGDVESILVVLWKMLFQFELQGDSDDADKNNNNKNKKNGFLTKEEIRKEIAILQKEIRSKLDFSSPVEEVESGDFASLLLTWIQLVVEPYGLPVYDLTQSLADGSLLSFVINYYHPSLLPLAAIKEVPGDDGHASTQHVQYTKEEREGFSKRESHNWKCIKLAAKAIGGIPTMILGEQVSTRNPPNEENMLIFLARFFMRLTASATQIRAVLVLQRWCRVHFLGREGGASKKREVTVRQHASSRFRRWQQRRQEGQPVAGGDSSSFALGQVKVGSKQESRFAQWKRANNLGDNVNTSKSPKLILKTTNSTISDATEQEEEEEGEGEEEGEEQGSDENSPVPQSLVDDINDDDGDIQPIQPPRPPSQEEEDEDQARLDISAVLAVRRVDVNGKGGGRDDEQHQLDDLLGLLSDDEEDEAAAVLVEQEQEAEEEAGQQRQALLLEVERSAAEALAKQRQQQEEEEQEVAAIALANRLAEEAVAEEEEKQRRVETQAILLQKQQLEEEEATAALAAEALAKQQQLALALQLEKEQAEAAALELAKAEAEAAAEAIAIQSEVSSLLADMTHGIISICQASVLNMATEIVDSLVTISVDEAEILRQRRLFEAELHYQFELQLEEERVREESRRMALHKYELLLQKCAMIITRCFQEHVARIKTRKMRVLKLKFEQEECETAAAIRLQSHFRRLRAQKKFRCAILAVSILQAMHRKKSILRTFKLMYSAATQIASCVRGYLVRKACANMKIMIFESQVLRGKQQLAQTVIGSSVMIYLKHKRRVAVAVKTQKLIRAKMLVWRVRNMVAGFRKLMVSDLIVATFFSSFGIKVLMLRAQFYIPNHEREIVIMREMHAILCLCRFILSDLSL